MIGLWVAELSVNSLVSLGDKVIAGFIALALARLLVTLHLGRDATGRALPLLRPRRHG